MIEILKNYMNEGFINNYLLPTLNANNSVSIEPHIVQGLENLKTLNEELQSLEEYVSFMNDATLVIAKVSYLPSNEKKYLRLGLLPESGKSFNFLTEQEENGVSVFDIVDGKPVINNLQLIDSFSGRHSFKAFFVTGEQIGIGHDGEPILTNVKYDSLANMNIEELTIEALDNAFNKKIGDFDQNVDEVNTFYTNGNLEVTYKGFTYSNPKSEFNTKMGKGRNV